MFYISQNFEKQKKSWVKDSNPNVLKKDCSEEPVETTKGKKNWDVCTSSLLLFNPSKGLSNCWIIF